MCLNFCLSRRDKPTVLLNTIAVLSLVLIAYAHLRFHPPNPADANREQYGAYSSYIALERVRLQGLGVWAY